MKIPNRPISRLSAALGIIAPSPLEWPPPFASVAGVALALAVIFLPCDSVALTGMNTFARKKASIDSSHYPTKAVSYGPAVAGPCISVCHNREPGVRRFISRDSPGSTQGELFLSQIDSLAPPQVGWETPACGFLLGGSAGITSQGTVPRDMGEDSYLAVDFIKKNAIWMAAVVVAGLLAVIALLTAMLINRGKTRRAIERAKQEWERTFDVVPDLISIIGPDHRILRLNVAMADRLGIRPHDAIGKQCHELVHGTAYPPPNCPHVRMMRDGQEHTEEIFEPRLQGSFRVSATPIEIPSGKLLGYVHVARDITDAKKAEAALVASEARYRAVVEDQTEMICRFLPDFTVTFVNEACCRFFGRKRQQLEGENFLLLFPEEERDRLAPRISSQYDQEPTSHLECSLTRNDGEPRWIVWSIRTIFQDENGLLEYQSVGQDVTERRRAELELRKSEEKYRTIIESIEDGYYESDLNGSLTFVNEPMERILGYPREKLVGQSYRDFTDKNGSEMTYQAFNEVYRSGTAGRVYDQKIVRQDGSVRFCSLSVSLVKDALGNPTGFRGICRDTTERKQAEEILLQKERISAVGEMAGGVAHNFNNLLQIVLGCAQLAVDDLSMGNASGAVSNLRQIIESSEWGARTIKRLQDFARVRSYDPTREGVIFDLSLTVKAAIEMSKPWWKAPAEKEGIKITLRQQLQDNCLVRGMENELFEVVVNLVKNAAEALPVGGRIDITTLALDGRVLLRVSDDGVGIAEENLGKVFEPFWTTKGVRGTGMGLAGSFGIVRRHGGELTVESVEGQGASFQINMPLASGRPASSEELSEPTTQVKLRILAVDNMEVIARQLAQGLEQFGHEVVTASSGVQAVHQFQQRTFDVVICDLGMPDINGWQVGKVLQRHCHKHGIPRPQFVLLTGWGGDLHEEGKMAESGVDAVVEKPIDVKRLLKVVVGLAADEPEPVS